MQSSIQYDWPDLELSLVLAPLGKAEGKRCKSEPFRSLLTVVPFDETTKHRFPAGLANTIPVLIKAVRNIDHPLRKHELTSEPAASFGAFEPSGMTDVDFANISGGVGFRFFNNRFGNKVEWLRIRVVVREGEDGGGEPASLQLSFSPVLSLSLQREFTAFLLIGDRRAFERSPDVVRRH
ncbi:hypothetical protein HanXRQr2_Chr16g0723411 [Helianthus annuus]|uniref:Uncharacterized protein n=1 Tax=Helianthus annuus TaxID=4232 RepID=A0A9K3DMA5_HELAN|nr:hypothetical protein HanXRQr2_Chr16g0723411 [Helianthus annuus]KAJ0819245.1 hypothetical protein HanPSC8_Chr16g0693891 [Helianthus annuus]